MYSILYLLYEEMCTKSKYLSFGNYMYSRLILTLYRHFTDTLLNATKCNSRKVCSLLNATRPLFLSKGHFH